MRKPTKFAAFVSLLAVTAALISACGVAPVGGYPMPRAPGYGPGGMMDNGHMNGDYMGSMMGGYGQSAPTAAPTPFGATPVEI